MHHICALKRFGRGHEPGGIKGTRPSLSGLPSAKHKFTPKLEGQYVCCLIYDMPHTYGSLPLDLGAGYIGCSLVLMPIFDSSIERL